MVAPEVPYIGLLAALDAIGKDQVYVNSIGSSASRSIMGRTSLPLHAHLKA